MTATLTTPTEAPAFDWAHSHTTADVIGYDVIRTSWTPAPIRPADQPAQTLIEVTAYIRGGEQYATALHLAKQHREIRDTPRGPVVVDGHWGYTAPRYACGCRWIATNLGERERRTDELPPRFVDLTAEVSPEAHGPECTGCAHDCPWQRTTPAPLGAPYCPTCDDHAEAVDAGYATA